MVTILILILIRIALLFERKNKERVVSVVGVNTTGRSIVIGEELATYDKVIVLNMLENDEEGYEKSDENEEEKKWEEEKERSVALGELLLSLIDDQYFAVHFCT